MSWKVIFLSSLSSSLSSSSSSSSFVLSLSLLLLLLFFFLILQLLLCWHYVCCSVGHRICSLPAGVAHVGRRKCLQCVEFHCHIGPLPSLRPPHQLPDAVGTWQLWARSLQSGQVCAHFSPKIKKEKKNLKTLLSLNPSPSKPLPIQCTASTSAH